MGLSRNVEVLDFAGTLRERVVFQMKDDDQVTSDNASVWLPQERWEDFGRPVQLTVTIEPGDRLNL